MLFPAISAHESLRHSTGSRSGFEERVCHREILHGSCLQLPQASLRTFGLTLEHSDRFTRREEISCGCIQERDRLEMKLWIVVFADKLACIRKYCERADTQQIEFRQA